MLKTHLDKILSPRYSRSWSFLFWIWKGNFQARHEQTGEQVAWVMLLMIAQPSFWKGVSYHKKHIWTYLNLSELIRLYQNLSEPYPKLSEPIQTYWKLSKHIQTYPNLSEPIHNYSIIPKPICTYPNPKNLVCFLRQNYVQSLIVYLVVRWWLKIVYGGMDDHGRKNGDENFLCFLSA